MSQKMDLAKEIAVLEKEMHELECKRARSMAALMEALISRKEPDETEMQYFRQYTAEIDVKRDKLIELTKRLQSII